MHDVGDAVLPVDQRRPAPAKARLFTALRPAVVETAEATPPTLAKLRDLRRGALGPVAAGRELVVVAARPRTRSGKVRRVLREAIAAGATGQ